MTPLTLLMIASTASSTFGDDVALLKQRTETFVLRQGDAAVAITPEFQARVMTSTSSGDLGPGYGWINEEAIIEGEIKPHINPWGGEDRFWIGPEGGPFSVFFKKGDAQDLTHWQTPAAIDTDTYKLVKKTDSMAEFSHRFEVTNYAGSSMTIAVSRVIEVLSPDVVTKYLGVHAPAGVKTVAYRSLNRVTNAGTEAWTQQVGAPSIWVLGMFKPGEKTTIVVPYNTTAKGEVVNDSYFGKVPASRLKVGKNAVFFSGDGQYRSKIGIAPARTKAYMGGSVLGSYDPIGGVLTIAHFSYEPGDKDYVNSMWDPNQKHPFGGDVANSYNDGPPSPGAKPLGPFYELESSSPALFLKPGESGSHIHATYHFHGTKAELDGIAKKVLGVSLDEVTSAF